ncbi:glycosyltransferase family 29 protein [Isoptericola halotolerans]|uniref:hypothetical protein n=1 Tax=Isoptericola halotolerans TaxID=300560 RepID=UPI003890EA7B
MERLRGGPRTRRQNVEFAALVAELGGLASVLSASAAWRDVQLTRAVVELQAAHAADQRDEVRNVDLALGRSAWHASPSRTWEALLLVARRARRSDAALTARIAALLLAARPDDAEASEVSQEALQAVRSATEEPWRKRAARRSATDVVASKLSTLSGTGAVDAGWFGVEESLRAGDDLALATAPELRRAYLGEPGADRAYIPSLHAGIARGLVGGLPLGRSQEILDTTAEQFSGKARPEIVDIDTVNISGLRDELAGKSICLVANSAELLDLELGQEIDAHDVVVRFNSFATDPVRTGVKTDVHATIHLHDFNWDVPVDIRIVFGGAPAPWAENVRRYVRPEAQRLLGDESLRWPRRSLLSPALRERCTVPTTGFNTLLLLDYLDVSTRIDLFGFNFHSGAPYRRDDAMHLPIAEAHSYEVEREWVAERTVETAPGRISLR